MPRSSTTQPGFFRALQVLLTPVSTLAKVAAGLVLFMVIVAGGLIWAFNAWVLSLTARPSPTRAADPPAEVHKLIARLASIPSFQGLTPTNDCKRPRRATLQSPPTAACSFVFGKTSVRVSWNTEIGRVWSVTVNASIPEAERAVHQSAPLDWLDFPAIQQVFCPNSDQVAVGTSLQRITQMPWVRWDGAKSVAAAPGEVNASRYMASTEGCSVSLIEKQGKVHLEVMLVYSLMGIRIDDLHPSQPL